jgi:membrane protease YdiL (CAAX protease family)
VLLYALLYALHAGRLAATGDRGLSYTGLFLLVTLLNSFLEEGLFRGIMLPQFMRRMAFWQANALQAALFGLWHLPLAIEGWVSGNGTASDALGGGAELFVATSTAGLVFGYLYYRTGSLWAPWLAHTIDNLVLKVFHLRTADGVSAARLTHRLPAARRGGVGSRDPLAYPAPAGVEHQARARRPTPVK